MIVRGELSRLREISQNLAKFPGIRVSSITVAEDGTVGFFEMAAI